MSTLKEYLVQKRAAYQVVKAAAALEPKAKAFHARCRVLGRSGIREVRIREFQILTDTPPNFAGYNAGANAPELMLGALSSCLAHTAIIVAADEGFALDALEVETSAKFHALAQRAGFEHIPVYPHDISYKLLITTSEPDARLEELHSRVKERCSLYNLIKPSQELKGEIVRTAPVAAAGKGTAVKPMKIGIIGAGFIGRAIATHAIRLGHVVMIANSRAPETLGSTLVALGCKGGTAEQVAAFGDVIVVAIPLKSYRSIPVAPTAGKIVIDANNYYPQRDGQITELDTHQATTSELLARHLPQARVVKAFNAILQKDLAEGGQPPGTPGRRALPIAGDDAAAKAIVGTLYDQFGYDSIDAGPLAEGWRFQRAMPAYCIALNATNMRRALAEAERGKEKPHGSWRG